LIAAQIVHLFGPLSGFHIAEIGGGYGNLANVLHILYPIGSYTMYDLPAVCKLQKCYLSKQGWEIDFPPLKDTERVVYDLVISCCSLSELVVEEQERYASILMNYCDRGFHVWNWKDRDDCTTPIKVNKAYDRLCKLLTNKQVKETRFTDDLVAVFAWG
jgi:hypothetical protein